MSSRRRPSVCGISASFGIEGKAGGEVSEIQLRQDVLLQIARFYGDLPRLREVIGSRVLSCPENVVDRLLDAIVKSDGNTSACFCNGHGAPHLWMDSQFRDRFEQPCAEHPERRTRERRRP